MASCCQKCVKMFVLVISAIILCCGFALLIISLVALNLDDYVPSDDFHDWIGYFKLALIILSIILMEIGIIGILSAWKQNKCLIFLYQIQITFFSLIFLVIGVAALIVYQNVVKDVTFFLVFISPLQISCQNLDVLDDASSVITKSQNLMCTSQCPCNCNNQEVLAIIQSQSQFSQISSLTQQSSTYNTLTISATGATRVQDCPTFTTTVGSYDTITKALSKIEEKFDCSGLCTINRIYLFSDINRGIPQNMCIEKVLDEMKKILKLLAGIGLAIGIIKFITVWVACFLCCKARKETGKVMDDYNQPTNNHNMEMQTPGQKQYY